jgi:large subunit ribosomal protein L4
MAKAKLYNQLGEEKGEETLNPKIFDVKMNQALVHQIYVCLESNRREVIAHTKDKSEVRGGGAKPWKQKGTGRARHGSRRSPLWVGGGVTFGPNNERNFTKKINKKMKRKATFMVLSDKVNENWLAVIDELNFEKPQTRIVSQLFNKLDLKSVLVVIEKTDHNVINSVRNIQKAQVVTAESVSLSVLLKYKNVIITKEALTVLDKVFLTK